MAVKFQLRRDTAANWTANNPILSEGEPGKYWKDAAPTGNAGKTDIVSFTLIRVGLDWTVLGSLTTYG